MVLFVHFSLFVQVYAHNLVTEDSLFSRSSEFEAAIQNGERSLLRVLCDKKSQESEYVFFAGHYFHQFCSSAIRNCAITFASLYSF